MAHSCSLNRSQTVLGSRFPVLATAPRHELQLPSAAGRPIVVLGDGSQAALNAQWRAAHIAQYRDVPVHLLGDWRLMHAETQVVAGAGLLVTHLQDGCRPMEWIFGSRMEQLIRRFSIPVLIVKQPANRRYRRVLIGVKLDEEAGALAAAARTLAPRAQINVVHVLGASQEYRWRTADVPEAAIRANRMRTHGDAYRKLNDLIAADWGHDAAAVARRLTVGHAPHRLLEMGAAARAGLLVLGKRPRHWLADLFLDRGTARTVLGESRSDVLLVPAK